LILIIQVTARALTIFARTKIASLALDRFLSLACERRTIAFPLRANAPEGGFMAIAVSPMLEAHLRR